jgi:hypothetical protein
MTMTAGMTDPYRTPEKINPQPTKIVQIIARGSCLIGLDDNGVVWISDATGSITYPFTQWKPAFKPDEGNQ